MKILVTGNIGCGKSTAVKYLHALMPSAQVFDFDAMIADLYRNDTVQKKLDAAFGTHSKEEISDIVFLEPEMMAKLRSICDGFITLHTKIAFRQQHIILDVPLYFEHIQPAGLLEATIPDYIVVVAANEQTQVERVMLRNGFSEARVRLVMSKQLPQQDKIDQADHVIWNLGTPEELLTEVVSFARKFNLIE